TSVTAAGWSEPASDGGFAAVMVTAPPAPARGGAMRLVLVLDRSATIRGDADAIQRPLVRALLANLSAADRVSIVGSEQVAWARPADALTAIESIWQRTSSRFDLTSVLARLRAERAAVVMITDGLVADDRAAIATAKQLGIPIHVIGVGPAPARGLLTQLAAATRGTIRFAGVGDDLSAIASARVLDAASPATAMTVTWGTLAVSDVVPGVLPRLGGGQSMLVLARIERAELANGRAHGELFAIVPGEPPRPVDGMTTAVGPLGRRWARARLEELIADGDRSAITAHALRFGLVSPETALVAIGSDVVVRNGVKHTVAVPVAVPAGIHATALERSKLEKSSAQIDAAPPGTAGSPKPLAGAAREDDSNDDAKSFAETEATAPSSTSAGRAAAPVALESRPLPRLPRLSGGFGGGIAITNSASDLVLGGSLRYEIAVNRRLALGAETSVWFGGRDAQGQVLATASILELATRWELAPGLGVRFGDGTGPAASIGVRFRVPALPQAAGFLRYDAALVRRPASDGWIFQHAPLVGIEWSLL
ncbi:MAG: vWA domain-containing protein, partial [Kofleriaceae bacterium]